MIQMGHDGQTNSAANNGMRKRGAVDCVKLLVAALLMLVTVSVGAAEPAMSDADYWRMTTLTLTYAKHFISNERCYSSAKYLFSCVQAANAAGSVQTSPVFIVADDRVESQELVLTRVPALAVVGHANLDRITGSSPWEIAQNAELERQHLIQASAASFEAAKAGGKRIDFERLLRDAQQDIPRGIPPQMMLGLAISAHLRVFDAHASIQPEGLVDGQFYEHSPTYYVGIGVTIHRLGNGARIEDVFSGAPADRAGLKVGDVITAITTEPGEPPIATAGRPISVITDLIGGTEGTSVTLQVTRVGKTLSLTASRGRVQRPKIESRIIGADGHRMGYLRIRSLEEVGGCSRARDALIRFEEDGARGVILDLRGNGGGQLMEGVCVAGLFLGNKHVVGIRPVRTSLPVGSGSGEDTSPSIVWMHGYSSKPSELPLVVLIDAGSASAAELVAGALQYYKRAWLIGERSFGKASVQTINVMDDNDTLSLAETTARFYLPNGMTTQRVGVTPDFEVSFEKGDSPADRFEPREADQFPDGLPALNTALPEMRPGEVAAIRSCVEEKMDDGKAASLAGAPNAVDYQKSYAIAVLKCSVQLYKRSSTPP